MLLSIPPFLVDILIALALAGGLCVAAVYKKWLNKSGAIAATVMGSIIWPAGGWSTTLPMLFFFVTGSLFSKLSNKKKIIADAKQNKARDYIQVWCNGGVAAVCLLLWIITKDSYWILAYCASLATSTSDTWSSELGVRFGGTVVDIIGFKKLPTGISGGISLTGTLAGLFGSLLVGTVCYFSLRLPISHVVIIASAGFLGMLIDSILGSRLQARYRLQNGTPSECLKPAATLDKGFSWMTNDLVNIVANLLITVATIAVVKLIM
jgi:uncharacterized protein (TIGR00297 family)